MEKMSVIEAEGNPYDNQKIRVVRSLGYSIYSKKNVAVGEVNFQFLFKLLFLFKLMIKLILG